LYVENAGNGTFDAKCLMFDAKRSLFLRCKFLPLPFHSPGFSLSGILRQASGVTFHELVTFYLSNFTDDM